MRRLTRYVIYVVLPWFVETSVFAFLLGPLSWVEWYLSMLERV